MILTQQRIFFVSLFVISLIVLSVTSQPQTFAEKTTQKQYTHANDITIHVVFSFRAAIEESDNFQVYRQISGFDHNSESPSFELAGVVDFDRSYLYEAADTTYKRGLHTNQHQYGQFDVDVYLNQKDNTLRHFKYVDCGVVNYKVDTLFDKEDGWNSNHGFAIIDKFVFECSGYKPINPLFGVNYADLFHNEDVSVNTEPDAIIEPYETAESTKTIQNVTIRIDLPFDDVQYGVDTPFPFKKLDENTFSIESDYDLNNSQITITGKLDESLHLGKQQSIPLEDIIKIKTTAITSDGKTISPSYSIHLLDDAQVVLAPNTHMIKPQQVMLVFPNDWETMTEKYRLVNLNLDNKPIDGRSLNFYADTDHFITIIYEKFVKVTVHDGIGTGIYKPGDIVVVSAPDKPKISFLVVEKFDYWIGTDESSVFIINAEKDIEITAVYKDDYTGLLIVVILIIGVAIITILKKRSN